MTGEGEIEFDDEHLKGWKVIYSGFKRKAQAGVGIVLAPHVNLQDIIHVEAGRIIGARVILNGIKLSLFSCYDPTDTKSYSEQIKENFYITLRNATNAVKTEYSSFKLIIGGDFNATIGRDCEPEKWICVGNNNDPDPTSSNGTRLLGFAEEQSLYIMNSMFGYKNIHRWSFHSNLGYKRRLDYILCEGFIKRFCNNCRVYRSVSDGFYSDNKVVVMDCAIPSRKSRKQIFHKKKDTRSILDIKYLRHDETLVRCYSKALDASIGNTSNIVDINELDDKITTAIQTSSETTIPARKNVKDTKPWVDDTFLQLIESRNKCKNKNERLKLNKKVKQHRDKIKNEYYSKKAASINLASEARDVEAEFRKAKDYSLLNKSIRMLIAPEKLKEHFESHFAPRKIKEQPEIEHPLLFPHILPPDNICINEDLPTEEELKSAIKTLKNNKCEGTDNIYAEQLKYAKSSKLIAAILLLLTLIWTLIEVPKTWLYASITCLYKKGLKSLAKNYRSIFVMSTISRLLPKIILDRFGDSYERILMENQFGFRKNRSTTDAIFIVREAIRSTKNPIHLCMIDLRAAYDHIDRNMLFKVLEIRTKAHLLTAILKSLYTGTVAVIKHTVDQFHVHTGCRQGGIEAPVLFNIYMDFVLRCVEHEVLDQYPNTGLKYIYHIKSESSTREQRSIHGLSGHDRLHMLLYADDIVLFCENISELQCIINIYDITFSRFGLTIASDKTKTISFNAPEEIMNKKSLIILKDQPIENVRKFKYLGHVLSNENTHSSAFLNNQISNAYSKWNELKIVLLDKRILLATRIKILEACVRSRLLYSVQAWQLNTQEMQRLGSIWHSFLRRMVKGGFQRKNAPMNRNDTSIPHDEVNWAFKLSNEQLRKITKTTEIKNFCILQHLKYIAHITRLGNNSLQKQFLFCTTGNPCSRWRTLASTIEIDETQLRRTMMDRKGFKRLIDHAL